MAHTARRLGFAGVRSVVVVALALVVALLVFWPTLGSFFVSDDFVLVEWALADGLFMQWGEGHGGFLRPLIGLLFEMDAMLWGLEPLGYRVTNLLLHVATALLVGRLTARLACRLDGRRAAAGRARFAGLAATFLFLVHPSHGEAVVWIAGRTDLASTGLQVAGLIAVFAYLEAGGAARCGIALGAFAAALAAKESALPWPGLALVVGVCAVVGPTVSTADRALSLRRLAWLMSGSTVVLGAYFLLRRLLLGTWLGGYGSGRHLDFEVIGATTRLGRYVVRSLLPGTPATAEAAMPLLLPDAVPFLAAVVALILALANERRQTLAVPLIALSVAFVLSLSTALTVLQVDLATPKGERFLYLPTVFVCAAVAMALADLVSSKSLRPVVGAVLVLLSSWALASGMADWRLAADTSRRYVEVGTRSLPADESVWLTHLPAELKGRYVLAGGYGAALRLFAEEPPRDAVPLILMSTVEPGLGAKAWVEVDEQGERVTLLLYPGSWVRNSMVPPGWQLETLDDGRVVLEGEVPPDVVLANLGDPAPVSSSTP